MKKDFVIIHPLFDEPEEKCSAVDLEPMHMSASVRWSLLSLRIYLALMMLVLFYHVFELCFRM